MAKLFEYDESRTREQRKRSEARAQRLYRGPSPVTPIPRRASASSPRSARVPTRHPRTYTEFQEEDVTRLPTIPRSATWQDEADEYEIAEPTQQKKADLQFPLEICELATNPPPIPFQLYRSEKASYIDDVVEADTVMDDTLIVVSSLPADVAMYSTPVEDVVDVALTVRARELLRRKGSTEDRPAFIHNPRDYIRWWLLYPGRLEFLFWLGGALLVGVIMCVILVVTGLGLGFMSFGHMAH